MGRWWWLVCLLLLPGWAWSEEGNARPAARLAEYESLLVHGLEKIQADRLDDAIADFALLTRKKPDFRLAQLIYGDLLMARAGRLNNVGSMPAGSDEIATLLEEARARFQWHRERPRDGYVPENILRLSNSTRHVVVVDLSLSRLYLFYLDAKQGLRLSADFYVSSGKNGPDKYREGDKKTPVGVYFITSFISDEQLPDFYGAGALPINYPNEWDRLKDKTGYGIWLHGTPTDTYSRPPRASDGCVALTNPDFETLRRLVPMGSPVIISDRISWAAAEIVQEASHAMGKRLDDWQSDWQKGEVAGIQRYYSESFHSKTADFPQWLDDLKRRLAEGNTPAFKVENVNIFRYPSSNGDAPMLLVTFTRRLGKEQEESRIHQYWRRESEDWMIVYEDVA